MKSNKKTYTYAVGHTRAVIQEVEDRIAASIVESKRYTTEEVSDITRLTNETQIAIFQTAPRELPKLNVQIALKTKAHNLEKDRRKRTLLMAELEALQQIRDILIDVNNSKEREQEHNNAYGSKTKKSKAIKR
jgi:tRNA A37 N6-isopentenylltransferase MiaA